MLDDVINAHKPHPKSLVDEESKEAYNEEEARQAFGDESIDRLKKDQPEFKGDWWQLALLLNSLEEDSQNRQITQENRFVRVSNQWGLQRWKLGRGGAHERIHLEYARLNGAQLEGAMLDYAHLEHANLWEADLRHALLWFAHLEDADVSFADLEHARLEGAHLEHGVLGCTQLGYANLVCAHFEHANVEGAHLAGANLEGTYLAHASLESADLEYANLRDADLEHAKLTEANLDGADVRGATGLLFNGNRVEGVHIEGNAPDPWSVLRRKYTGPWFFVHLSLLAIFFTPYVGHALYLTAKSRFQEWSVEQYNALGDRAADLPGLSEYHAELQRRFSEEYEQRRAVWVLLGLHRGFLPIALAAIVVLYNATRGFLTLRVSTLRDAEERSSITPTLEEYYGVCHPLSADPPPRIRRMLQTWCSTQCSAQFFAFPRWVRVPEWFKRRCRVVSWMAGLKPPYSFVTCFGLYRLHLVARLLLLAAVAAVLYNTLVWIVDTWIWVPVGS